MRRKVKKKCESCEGTGTAKGVTPGLVRFCNYCLGSGKALRPYVVRKEKAVK